MSSPREPAGAPPRREDPEARLELESALARARSELDRLTRQDALTGCLNRAGLAHALEMLRHTPGPIGAIVLDCDDFERVNLQLGYAAGDLVLREIATRLRDSLGADAPLARIGGDRFLALLPGLGSKALGGVAERLRLAIAWAPFAWEPKPIHLTASFGVAEIPSADISSEEVLSIARVALDKSKRRGKNRISAPEDTTTLTQLLAPSLRAFMAVVQGGEGLVLHAQPIVSLPSEVVAGWEVLVRGPPGALALPGDLFRMADEHHVSTALDMFCLRLAVSGAASLGRPGVFHLNVLPTTLLEVPADQIQALLQAPPAGVTWCVELSERQFLGDPEELVDAVAAVRAVGAQVAVDDVGSGRGTLDSVVALEPDVAKLDIRLVRGVSKDPRRRRFLERLVRVAHTLGAELVAEGVETREDLAVLLELGVPLGQGWLWGRAVPLDGLRL
jgi:diguanylate cyclase (GGDEF)-like protein